MKGNIFIKRPVMAMSIAIVILFLGLLSYLSLPVEQFPDIAPPTVVVSATYPGASAETVTKAVIQPIEESVNGVESAKLRSRPAGGADKRCGEHDVHDLDGHELRFCSNYSILQAGNKS